jgi:hypothetical protein
MKKFASRKIIKDQLEVPLLKKGLIDSIFTLFYNYKNYCSQLRNFDFMSIDYTHCLRPRFTQDILEHLLSSTSVNVMVPQIGEEATRLNHGYSKLSFTKCSGINCEYACLS